MVSGDCRTLSTLRRGLATRKNAFIRMFTAVVPWAYDVLFGTASGTVCVAQVHGGKPQSATTMCLPIRAVWNNPLRYWNAKYCMRGPESKLKMDPHVEGRGKGAGIRRRVLLRVPKSRCEVTGIRRSAQKVHML